MVLPYNDMDYGEIYTSGTGVTISDSNEISTSQPSLLIATGAGLLDFGSNIDKPINFSSITVTGSASSSDFPVNGSVWTCPESGVYHTDCCSYMHATAGDHIQNHFLYLQISTNSGGSFSNIGTSKIQLGNNELIAGNSRHISRYINMSAGDQLRIIVNGRVSAGVVRVDFNDDRTMFQILRVK